MVGLCLHCRCWKLIALKKFKMRNRDHDLIVMLLLQGSVLRTKDNCCFVSQSYIYIRNTITSAPSLSTKMKIAN